MTKAKKPQKARLVWYHFCEHHSTDATGKNSYISVFDTMTVGIRYRRGTPRPPIPLPQPITTRPFVLVLHIQGQPDTVQETELTIEDSDGQPIVPVMRGRLARNAEGRNNLNIRFENGLPVLKGGVYSFRISVDGRFAGQAQLRIGLDIAEMGGS